MCLNEALWIHEILKKIDLRTGNTVINLGSGDERYRCLGQPYYDYWVFRPLRKKGIVTLHVDRFTSEGVDVVCDLTEPLKEDFARADVILCTSLLEHVTDVNVVVANIRKLIKPGGTFIITVPYQYKYHPDPIDTMFRPTNIELETLFTRDNDTVISSQIIEVDEDPIVIRRCLAIRIINRMIRFFHLSAVKVRLPVVIKNKVSVLAVTTHAEI